MLILALVLPLVGGVDAGNAAKATSNIDIVAIDLTGRQTNLTQNPADDLAPAVARDGRIAFVSTRDQDIPDFYVMDADGGNVRRLTSDAGVAWAEDLESSHATWSPRGDHVAFDGKYMAQPPNCLQHCANWDVLTIGADGSGLRQIVRQARAPAWSPNGRRIAYESGMDAYSIAQGVTITRVGGGGSVQLKAINHDSYVGPVWSPTGDELAFQAQRADGSPFSIYVVHADGRGKRRLSAGQDPTWSRDGRRLAFVDGYKLMTIDRSGKGKRRFSRKGELVVTAAWSPNGRAIAYVAGTKADPYAILPKNLRVERVTADGKHVHVLARVPALFADEAPVWTADGKRILVAVEAP